MKSNTKTKRCKELRPWLSAYVDGELEGIEHTRYRCRVEAHLDACVDCVDVAEQWSLDLALLEVPEDRVPSAPWFAQRFAQRLELESEETTKGQLVDRLQGQLRWVVWRSLPVAVAAFGLLLGVALRMQMEPPSMESELLSRLHQFESSAFAVSNALAAAPRDGRALAFDEVLRPGQVEGADKTTTITASTRTPFSKSGLESSTDLLRNRPEKDR